MRRPREPKDITQEDIEYLYEMKWKRVSDGVTITDINWKSDLKLIEVTVDDQKDFYKWSDFFFDFVSERTEKCTDFRSLPKNRANKDLTVSAWLCLLNGYTLIEKYMRENQKEALSKHEHFKIQEYIFGRIGDAYLDVSKSTIPDWIEPEICDFLSPLKENVYS